MRNNLTDRGMRSGGAFVWYFQRISGVILVFTLLAHFWVLHFFAPDHGNITYQSVMERLQHPAWKVIDLTFLVLGLYHGMNGIMIVIYDYINRPMVRMFVVGAVWIIVLWFMVLGSLTILGLPTGGMF